MSGSDSSENRQSDGTRTELTITNSQFKTLLDSLTKISSRFDRIEKDIYDSENDEDDMGSLVGDQHQDATPRKDLFGTKRHHSESDHDDTASVSGLKKQKSDEPPPNPLQVINQAHDNDLDFQALLDEYGATKPKALADPVTDPMLDALCKILETWFWGHYSSREIKNEQAKRRCPANATAIIPCQINEELYHAISP